MNQIYSRVVFIGLTFICSPASAVDNAYHRFAECIGGGDVYAESAAQYGYDLEAHNKNSELQMMQLTQSDEAPSVAVLEKQREIGRRKYKRLQSALKGKQEGPAWDEFSFFHSECDAVRELSLIHI